MCQSSACPCSGELPIHVGATKILAVSLDITVDVAVWECPNLSPFFRATNHQIYSFRLPLFFLFRTPSSPSDRLNLYIARAMVDRIACVGFVRHCLNGASNVPDRVFACDSRVSSLLYLAPVLSTNLPSTAAFQTVALAIVLPASTVDSHRF